MAKLAKVVQELRRWELLTLLHEGRGLAGPGSQVLQGSFHVAFCSHNVLQWPHSPAACPKLLADARHGNGLRVAHRTLSNSCEAGEPGAQRSKSVDHAYPFGCIRGRAGN